MSETILVIDDSSDIRALLEGMGLREGSTTTPGEFVDALIAAIRQLAGDRPIRYILNTHAHPDHTGGNLKVAAAGSQLTAKVQATDDLSGVRGMYFYAFGPDNAISMNLYWQLPATANQGIAAGGVAAGTKVVDTRTGVFTASAR